MPDFLAWICTSFSDKTVNARSSGLPTWALGMGAFMRRMRLPLTVSSTLVLAAEIFWTTGGGVVISSASDEIVTSATRIAAAEGMQRT
jgi:hypothetical protein